MTVRDSIVCLGLILLPPVLAGPRSSSSYSVSAESIDAGGADGTSAAYNSAGTLGGITGVSAVAAPAQTIRHGFMAQRFEPAMLTLSAAVVAVPETEGLQLSATYRGEDEGIDASVSPGMVAWIIVSGPLSSISATGLVSTSAIPSEGQAVVSGGYLDAAGRFLFTVLNTQPDNFGLYAGDGLADDWQETHFGLENPSAAPGFDADGDGQDNEFEFHAGLIPTDAASVFTIQMQMVPGEPAQRKIVFWPRWKERTYVVQTSLDLAVWDPLTEISTVDDGTMRSVTDLFGTGRKFYRILIGLP